MENTESKLYRARYYSNHAGTFTEWEVVTAVRADELLETSPAYPGSYWEVEKLAD